MFYKLNELLKFNKPVVIKWYYSEDEYEMFEVGQDFAFMVNIPFHFIEYNHTFLSITIRYFILISCSCFTEPIL